MPRWFVSPSKLRQKGIMGMNKRNADFIMRYNPRRLYPLVDNKLLTKRLALKNQIAVPELYGVVEIQHQLRDLEKMLAPYSQFVIKPVHGSGGNGIMVVTGRMGNGFRKAGGEPITLESLEHHVSNILSGMYSLGGIPDKAIIEYCVQFDPFFEHIIFRGVPDIRVIVFRGVPVSAMIRLPTRESDGKANLHQGAMGIGVDIASGVSCSGVHHDKTLTHHPDTGHSVESIEIPHWRQILNIAVHCADTVGLGYLGVDIVMDRNLGPLMLELNARPGLNVQLANQAGLLKKLEKVENIKQLPKSIEERLALAEGL
ncbi:alpha-L-glutamate ligase-like protein [Alkalimarinus coralli]|uniref:alpha-L-glutamate ligase-like protein n=1 Tax=Alkalimarinus coralli TaxID=2935863 RepID=UPI00202B6D35|nr:alpha-L-glutamate ligase-like protein [Alkalimarinus coralli]